MPKKKVCPKLTIVSDEEIQKLIVKFYRFSVILFFAAHLKIKTLTLQILDMKNVQYTFW